MPAMRLNLLVIGVCFGFTAGAVAQETVDYQKHVKPILARHCVECHGAKKPRSGLRLDLGAEILKGSDNGAVVVPGQGSKSLLIHSLHGSPEMPRMPYKRSPLNQREVAMLVKWIDQGAKVPAVETAEAEKHWAFETPVRPKVPAVKNKKWVKNPIDHFILARLEQEKIAPSSEADKIVLLRRVYLDLIGLPPSIAEVEAFLNDARPDAYERVVDQLLNSAHYGEKWARHWLDLARYADTHGYTIDAPREIWQYRDWVINAFNNDLSFDQFVIEQMAGDMLPGAKFEQKIATGFHRNTQINQEGGIDGEQFRVEAVADRVSTTGTVFLGLTLGCARCHDHKYDPISHKEYFQIFAFLNNQSEPTLNIADPEVSAQRDELQAKMEKLEDDLSAQLKLLVTMLPDEEKDRIKDSISLILNLRPDQRTDAQKKQLAKYFQDKKADALIQSPKLAEVRKQFAKLETIKKQMPKFPTTMVLQELAKPRTTHIHIQGDFTRPGDKVEPGVLGVLHPLTAKNGKNPNRLDLAYWLVDPKNPLLGRVTVNRLWQRYFGQGLVDTENDFGTQGSPPSHPELLDWLATELIQQGWSLKKMHKLIVTSATYRQSSKARPELVKLDPYNKLLARQSRMRLEAELVRDGALAASGLLSAKIGGPSVFPPQPDGVYAFTQVKRAWKTSTGEDRYRRGIYTFLQRSAPYPGLTVFDAPDGNAACTRRVRSNTPLQALTLLNDKAYLELAHGMAYRIFKEGLQDDKGRLDYAFRLALVRAPSAWELGKLEQFLHLQIKQYQSDPKAAEALLKAEKGAAINLLKCDLPAAIPTADRAAWTAVTRVLLNLDEFITRE